MMKNKVNQKLSLTLVMKNVMNILHINLKIITRRDGQNTKSEHMERRKKGKFQESFLSYHNILNK